MIENTNQYEELKLSKEDLVRYKISKPKVQTSKVWADKHSKPQIDPSLVELNRKLQTVAAQPVIRVGFFLGIGMTFGMMAAGVLFAGALFVGMVCLAILGAGTT